jgi:hypothetical protein
LVREKGGLFYLYLDMGVSHAAVATMNVGLKEEEHIDAIKRFWDAAHTMI